MEEIEPLLRYCRYNLDTATGDAAAAEEHLLEMEREDSTAGGDLLAAKLESVVAEARKKQASALDSVEWRGKKVAVRSETLRVALVKADELARRLGAGAGAAAAAAGGDGSSSGEDPKPGQYLKVFGAYDDALATVSEELSRLQGKGGGVKMEAHRAELEALRAYAQHHKLRLMLQRNERLVEELQKKRKAGGGGEGGGAAAGGGDRDRDPVGEVADIVHVYDALLQSVRSMVTNLVGGEDTSGERGGAMIGNRRNGVLLFSRMRLLSTQYLLNPFVEVVRLFVAIPDARPTLCPALPGKTCTDVRCPLFWRQTISPRRRTSWWRASGRTRQGLGRSAASSSSRPCRPSRRCPTCVL